jgi:hypothetical protein
LRPSAQHSRRRRPQVSASLIFDAMGRPLKLRRCGRSSDSRGNRCRNGAAVLRYQPGRKRLFQRPNPFAAFDQRADPPVALGKELFAD